MQTFVKKKSDLNQNHDEIEKNEREMNVEWHGWYVPMIFIE